jgi:lipopolysaccharide transport system permease protein
MLIKKVHFPWNLLVLSVIGNLGIQFLLSLPVLMLIAIWHGYPASLAWLAGVPLLAGIQFATLYGLSLAIASANVYFRDLERLVSLAVTFLFFLTPIAYSVKMVPVTYDWLLYLNPLTSLMLGWQQLFLLGVLEWKFISVAAGISLLSVLLGTFIYKRLSMRFAEVI